MSARLNTRLAALEKSANPKAGIADSIRRAYRELDAGITGKPVTGGKIASAILASRSAKES